MAASTVSKATPRSGDIPRLLLLLLLRLPFFVCPFFLLPYLCAPVLSWSGMRSISPPKLCSCSTACTLARTPGTLSNIMSSNVHRTNSTSSELILVCFPNKIISPNVNAAVLLLCHAPPLLLRPPSNEALAVVVLLLLMAMSLQMVRIKGPHLNVEEECEPTTLTEDNVCAQANKTVYREDFARG